MDAHGELTAIQLDRIEQSLLVAAYFRGQRDLDETWHASANQIVTLSLFYTGDISSDDCVERFATRSYMKRIYEQGELREEIALRYRSRQSHLNLRHFSKGVSGIKGA